MIIRFKDTKVPKMCLTCPARYEDGYFSDSPNYCMATGELLIDLCTKPDNCPAEEDEECSN